MEKVPRLKWIYGHEICSIYDVKNAELWEAIETRKLPPYTNEGEPINVDRIIRWMNKKIEAGSMMLKIAHQLAQEQQTDIDDIMPPDLARRTPRNVRLTIYKAVKRYRYKIDDVETLFESQKHLPETVNELSQKTNEAPGLMTEPSREMKELNTIEQKALDDAGNFIRNLKISYGNDTSVILTPKGKNSQEYSCLEMGFKQTSKTWTMFIGILQNDDHKYHIGIYSKDKDSVKNREYNNATKRLADFSKKFVTFLNETYSTKIPIGLNVFENLKNIERGGTYQPIFKVVTNIEANIKVKTKCQLLKELEDLLKQKQQEKDPDKKGKLLSQIGVLLERGKKESWITVAEARSFLDKDNEDGEEPSPGDALAHTIRGLL